MPNGLIKSFFECGADYLVKHFDKSGRATSSIVQMFDDESCPVFFNGDYFAIIEKRPKNYMSKFVIWALTIISADRERAIDDWRDIYSIKNVLVGHDVEAVLVFPLPKTSESRKKCSLTLFCFMEHDFIKFPSVPIGIFNKNISSTSPFSGNTQRPLPQEWFCNGVACGLCQICHKKHLPSSEAVLE